MKAICIDDRWTVIKGSKKVKMPSMSEIVTVVKSYEDSEGKWYNLAGYSDKLDFDQAAFAPISDLDEKKIQHNRKKPVVDQHEEVTSLDFALALN